jgi:hypothetical protein
MRNRLIFGLFLVGPVLAAPSLSQAVEHETSTSTFANAAVELATQQAASPLMFFQSDPSSDRDTLWNGVLIGAGVGAAVGMLIAPQAYCGAHDTECSTIVRVAIGLPAIAGGIGVGALVDGLMSRRSSPVSGLQVNSTF